MPKSRNRKRPFSRQSGEPRQARGPSPAKRWAAPLMLTCWLLGLIWVILYYVLQDKLPLAGDLGGWNLVIGMGLIGVGFIFATQWE